MPARRSNPKRRCAERRAARLRSAALRSVFREAAQAVVPEARRLNEDFHTLPPPRHKGGAPKGNRNAWKHGARSRERRVLFAELHALVEEGRALLAVLARIRPVIPGERERIGVRAREGDPGGTI